MLLLDASEQAGAARATGVSVDGGRGVGDVEFFRVGCDGEVGGGDDGNDGEEGAVGLPAFGAAASVVVDDVGGEVEGSKTSDTVSMWLWGIMR